MVSNQNIGVYLRCSTQDQSTDIQANDLVKYVKARDWQTVYYFEDMATGKNANRPMFKNMMEMAKRRELDVIVVWKLDRLFRSLKDLVFTLQEFSELGIDFISLKDNIDMTTSSGRLLTHILAAFAEFEANIIRERVMAGLDNARKKGKQLGRPSKIDLEKLKILRGQGRSLSQIAKQLGVSKSAVSKTLSKLGLNKPHQLMETTGTEDRSNK